MMKIENIKNIADFRNYVEGCLNDLSNGVSTKEETEEYLMNLFLHFLKKANSPELSDAAPVDGGTIVEIKTAMDHLRVIRSVVQPSQISPYITRPIKEKIMKLSLEHIFTILKNKMEYQRGANAHGEGKIYVYTNPVNYFEQGFADADGLAVVLASILKDVNIDFQYRLAKYEEHKDFQHIYIIVPKRKDADLSKRDNYYVMDLTQKEFNKEHPTNGFHENFMA